MSSDKLIYTKERQPVDFYDVASQFIEEMTKSSDSHRLLKEWAHRYPQHASELADLAYASLTDGDGSGADVKGIEVESVIESARRIINKPIGSAAVLHSLIGAAKDAGLSASQLAKSVRIDVPILAKLEQRLLSAGSIPTALIDMLATTISRNSDEIVAYLQLPPQLAAGVQYKSKKPPSIQGAPRQKFKDAIRTSTMLLSEDKQYWMEDQSAKEQADDAGR